MAQRKIPYLKVVEPPENPKQLKKAERKVRWKKWEGAVSILILAVLAICGTYLLLDNKCCSLWQTTDGHRLIRMWMQNIRV